MLEAQEPHDLVVVFLPIAVAGETFVVDAGSPAHTPVTSLMRPLQKYAYGLKCHYSNLFQNLLCRFFPACKRPFHGGRIVSAA